MKTNRFFFLLVILAVASIVSSCETKTETSQPNNTVVVKDEVNKEKQTSERRTLAVGIINSDSLMTNYKYATKLLDELTAQSIKYQSLLRQKETALRARMQKYQTESSSMSQFESQSKQRSLYEEQEKLQLKQEEYSQKIMLLEQQYNRDIDFAINEFLNRYCADKPYDMVLSNTDLGMIRWYNKSLDVTEEVLAGLNVEFEVQQSELTLENK